MRRVAFVTGASSGIGRALAVRLGREGWAVGLAARRRPELQACADEIVGDGGRAAVQACDVADPAQVARAVAGAEEALGPIDLLVAAAGISGATPVDGLTSSEVERMMRVNFMGAVHAAEAVLPSMLARGSGHLVVIGSLAGFGGVGGAAAYAASKAALHRFFESLRIDLDGRGVAVTVIAPGFIRTPMTDRYFASPPFLMELDDAVDRIHRSIERRDRAQLFPRPLSTLAWLGQITPRGLYDRVAARFGGTRPR